MIKKDVIHVFVTVIDLTDSDNVISIEYPITPEYLYETLLLFLDSDLSFMGFNPDNFELSSIEFIS